MKQQRVVIIKEPGKKELVVEFGKEGEEVEVLALIVANQPDDYYLKIVVDHKVGKTFGRVMVRGISKNGARVHVEGMIKIDKKANGVDDFLEMRLLILDDKSQAVAEPKLEIEANEVKASHAATVGKIDREQLFYLESRGINRNKAEELIVNGFLTEVTEKINNPSLRASTEVKYKYV